MAKGKFLFVCIFLEEIRSPDFTAGIVEQVVPGASTEGQQGMWADYAEIRRKQEEEALDRNIAADLAQRASENCGRL